jgi:hypothetical protein
MNIRNIISIFFLVNAISNITAMDRDKKSQSLTKYKRNLDRASLFATLTAICTGVTIEGRSVWKCARAAGKTRLRSTFIMGIAAFGGGTLAALITNTVADEISDSLFKRYAQQQEKLELLTLLEKTEIEEIVHQKS